MSKIQFSRLQETIKDLDCLRRRNESVVRTRATGAAGFVEIRGRLSRCAEEKDKRLGCDSNLPSPLTPANKKI